MIRKQIVSLLARRPTPEVMEILKDAARDDRDDDVRKEAASWIERINIRRIPVQLNYYVFEARLTDASEYSKAPEGKTAVFFIPRDSSGGETAALMGIGRFFNKRIVFTGSKATSLNAAERYEFTKIQADSFTTSHRIAGFNIALDEDSIKKTTESIEGRIFIDGKASPFKVDDKNSILMAARRGDRLAVMVLEMRPKDSPAGEGGGEPAWIALPDDFTLKMNPVYYSVVHTMGIVVNSTRRSMDLGSVNTDVDDFLLAKAEIPGPRGTWTLTGYILLLKKESMLVGRMAKLVKPDGTIAAEGDEIRVPIKDPAAFTMTGGKIGTAKEKPGGIGLFPVLTVEGGVQIFSSGMNLTGDALDCGQSRATIPGPGGIWTLSGRLVFMKGDRRFVAKDAELKNSQGKVVAQGAVIAVPIQNPEKFTLEKERSD